MKNYDLIQARNGTIPQFEGQDGQPKAVTGDHGPYYQLVDVNGNPLFSENNPAHVQLTGSILVDMKSGTETIPSEAFFAVIDLDSAFPKQLSQIMMGVNASHSNWRLRIRLGRRTGAADARLEIFYDADSLKHVDCAIQPDYFEERTYILPPLTMFGNMYYITIHNDDVQKDLDIDYSLLGVIPKGGIK